MGRRKKILTKAQALRYLMANPKGTKGGRPPKEFHVSLDQMDDDRWYSLALACCQILIRPGRPGEKWNERPIYLWLPFDFRKRMPELPKGRFVKEHEKGWWVCWRFSAKKVLDICYKMGYSNFNSKDFRYIARTCSIELKKIEQELEWVIPADVFTTMHDYVIDELEKLEDNVD